MIRGAALLALAAAPANPAPSEVALPPFTPTVMIVEYEKPVRYLGQPASCANDICLMELYEEHAQRIKHISGPVIPRRFLLRTTSHSMYVLLRPGSRIIVAVSDFEDKGTVGKFAYWWQPEDEHRRICLTEEQIEDLHAHAAFRSAPRKLAYVDGLTKENVWKRCLPV